MRKTLVAIAVACAFASPQARAQQAGTLPTGGRVVGGQATISQSGSAMQIQQASNRAALDWQSFSIGSGASVVFNQPSASAIALNRVLGTDLSAIFGRLSANGQVFLTNPNGILFAPGAQVDVGGLLASTLSMSPEDFMSGRYVLRGDGATGSIVNQGSLRALPRGYVALIAPSVANEGTIETPRGTSALVGASAATMSFLADGLVQVRVDEGALRSEIANSGAIRADGGAVLLTARARDSLGRAVVNNSGVIEARGVENVNGVIRLLGNEVIVQSGLLDASSDSGGGEILVGGNYKGGGPEHNASRTYVGSDAVLDASATASGDGGKVIIWSDDVTRVYGQINARGGAQGGNGGFVETSSKGYLVVARAPDVGAPSGNGGTWLLDPLNITVTGANNNIADVDGGADFNYQPTASPSTIAAATIVTALNSGNVILDTSVAGGEAGDITISSAISAAPGVTRSLTFNANNNINVNASVGSTSGALNLIFNPGGAINLGTTTLNANGGAINAAGKTVNLSGGGAATINSAMSIGTLNLSNGTLSGTGTLNVGAFNWSGAATSILGGSGTLNANGGTAISGTGTKVMQGGQQLVLGGAATWDGQGGIQINNTNTRLTIGAAGSFDITNDSGPTIQSADGVGSILNQGLLKKSGGTGTTTLVSNLAFSNNGGTVQVSSGTLAINGGTISGIPHTGTFTADASRILNLAGSQTFDESVINGSGRVQLTSGSMTFTGTTNGVHVQGATTLANTGATVTGAGKLTADAGTTFELSGNGQQSNTGTSTLAGQFNWLGSSTTILGGSGTLSANGGTTISGTGTKVMQGGQQLVLGGSGTWDGQGHIQINNTNTRLTIGATGSFDITSDSGVTISSADGVGSLLNQGLFKKSGGSGTSTVNSNLKFSNDTGGTVQVSSGTIELLGGSISGTPHKGTFIADTSRILNMAGTQIFDESVINGSGRVQLTSGSMTFTGSTNGVHVQGTTTLANTGATVSGAGKLTGDAGTTFELSGNGQQSNTGPSTLAGQFNWIGPGTSVLGGSGTLNANGGTTISGTGTKVMQGGQQLVLGGAATWDGQGNIQINNTNTRLTIGAAGSFDITNDSIANMQSADGVGSILNQGLFKKSGGIATSTVNSNLDFSNVGGTVLNASSGTLQLLGGSISGIPHTGTFTSTNGPMNLAGSHDFGESIVNGSGRVQLTSGSMTFTGTTNGVHVQGTATLANTGATVTGAGKLTGDAGTTFELSGTGSAVQSNTGTSTLSGQFNWIGPGTSVLGGSGTLNANGGTTISGSGTKVMQGGRQLVLGGAGTWDGQGNIQINNTNTRLTIGAAGSFDITNDSIANMQSADGVGSILNQGLFKKSGGISTSTVSSNLDFSNVGGTVLNASSGTLALNGGSISGIPHTGTFTSTNGPLNLAGSHDFGESIVNGSGRVQLTSGSMTFTGTTNGVHIQGTATLANTGATVSGAGKLTSDAGATFELSGTGTQSNTGTSTLAGQFNWSNVGTSTLGGSGTLNANGGLAISNTGTKVMEGGRQLVVGGAGSWDGQATIQINNTNTRLTIGAAGSFDITNDSIANMQSADGVGSILNQGLFKKSGGIGTSTVASSVDFSNVGGTVLQTSSGTLALLGGSISGAPHTGTFTSTNGPLNLGGAHTFDESVVTGAGRVQLTTGSMTFTGTTNGVHIQSGGTLANTGATVTGAGKLTSDAGTAFELSGTGTQSNTGTSTLAGQFNWSNTGTSTLGGSGTLNANGGMAISNTGTKVMDGGRQLVVGGAGTWDGQGTIQINNTNTRLTIGAAGSFDITNDSIANMQSADGVGSIRNQGLFKKSGGTGTTSVLSSVAFENQSTGTIAVTSGTLSIGGTFTQSGTIDTGAGATFTRSGGFISTGTVRGSGTINVGAGNTLTNDGTVQPGGPGTVGTLNITGNYTQSAGGVLSMDLGGTGAGNFDKLVVTEPGSTANLAGTLNVGLVSPYTGSLSDSFTGMLTYSSRTGTFGTINAPTGAGLTPTYGGTGLDLLISSLVNNWTVDASGDWNLASNWSRGVVPGAGDDVVINRAAGTFTVTASAGTQTARSISMTGDENLTLSGGSLDIAQPSSIAGTLTLSGGTLQGAGDVTVNGSLNWNAGTIIGNGSNVLTTTGTTALASSSIKTLTSRTWNNAGTVNWSNGSLALSNASAVFNNQAGATLNASTPNSGDAIFGSGTLNNAGAFAVSGVSPKIRISTSGAFNNTGSVTISNGFMEIHRGGTDTGSYTVGAGTSLEFARGTRNLNSGASIGGAGEVALVSGFSPVVNLNSGASYAPADTELRSGAAGGTLNLNTGSLVSLASLTVDSGTLSGADDITVTGAFTWSNSTISGSGLLSTSVTSAVGGGFSKNLHRNWSNFGTANLNDGNINFLSGVTLSNKPGAIFNITSTHPSPIQTGTAADFVNQGTLNLNSGTVSQFGKFSNSSLVNVNSGTLNLAGDGTDTGTYAVASGRTLQMSGGTRTLSAGSDVTGAGAVNVAGGTVNVNGGYGISATGTTSITGSTSVLNFNVPLTFANTFTLSRGRLQGTGNLVLNGPFNWSGNGVNLAIIAGSGTLTTNGTTTVTDVGNHINKAWTNTGTVNVASGGNLKFRTSATTWTNAATGVINLTGSSNPTISTFSGGGHVLLNQGTINSSGLHTIGDGSGGLAFHNAGTVNVNSSTLNIENGGTDTGLYAVAAGTTLAFTRGTRTLSAGSDVTGAGAVNFSTQDTVDVNGGYSISATGTTSLTGSGAVLNFNLPLTFANTFTLSGSNTTTLGGTGNLVFNGPFNWSSGTVTGSGLFTTTGTSTLSTASGHNLIDRTWNNAGTVNLADGALALGGVASVFNNQAAATFDIAASNTSGVPIDGAPGSSFNNAGVLNQNASGTKAIQNTNFNNQASGTVNVNAGTLDVQSPFTQAGNIAIASGATLRKTGGFSSTGTLKGTGTVDVGAGSTLTSNGTVAPGASPGTLSVTGNYTQGAGGVLNVELGGTAAGAYDELAVSGMANLGGTLNVSLVAPYAGSSGDSFPNVITHFGSAGTFGTINNATSFVLLTTYNPTSVALAFEPAAALPSPQPATPPPPHTPPAPTEPQAESPPMTAAVNTATTTGSSSSPPAASYGSLTGPLASSAPLLAIPPNALMIPDFGALLAEMSRKRDSKRSALAKAVSMLERDPTIADLPACAGTAGGDCIVVRNDATPPGERTLQAPKLAHLPSIERKVALLIGVADYAEPIQSLASPVKDIEEIGRIYREQLGYEVRILANADKATIVRELNRLILESGRSDSVTVMYAGHGHVVERTQRGYWIPAKASADDPRQWISNTDIGKVLENIPAKQVLLVSDSCYSGTLAREARIERAEVLPDHAAVLERRSVTVLSSGGDEPVPDQGKDGHSVFAWHFMRQLRAISNVTLGVSVHEGVAARVQADIPQQPQYGAGLSSGHQRGGDYLFEVRRYE
jgi:fibronectin-binding autotransporter adhesin